MLAYLRKTRYGYIIPHDRHNRCMCPVKCVNRLVRSRSYELDETVFFPLDMPTQEPREVGVQSLVAQVERIVDLLPKRDRS